MRCVLSVKPTQAGCRDESCACPPGIAGTPEMGLSAPEWALLHPAPRGPKACPRCSLTVHSPFPVSRRIGQLVQVGPFLGGLRVASQPLRPEIRVRLEILDLLLRDGRRHPQRPAVRARGRLVLTEGPAHLCHLCEEFISPPCHLPRVQILLRQSKPRG